MLTCHNLHYERGGKPLFKGLGLTLFPGSVLIIRGANGCGKTTLLRTLAGLTRPQQGSIAWNDVNIHDEFDTYCNLMHYVGHKTAIKPQLTVRQNVEFWARLRGTAEMVASALHYFGLTPLQNRPCHTLSAGWKQRVALARMVSCYSKLWLLDEPTTHLDDEGIGLLMNMLAVRCQEGGIVVIATHGELPLLTPAVEIQLGEWNEL